MTDLPSGWAWSTLGEIGEYLNGRGFKKSEWREAGRPIIRIQNLTGSGEAFNYYQGDAEDRHVVRDGDLLVSWAATLGVYVWRGPEAVLNQHIFKVQSHVDPLFHRYLLSHVLADLLRQTHGSGMVHITKGRFDSTCVPVPPLIEQERIVAAIEEHLTRIDAANAWLQSALARLKALRRLVIDDALEGAPVPLKQVLAEPLRNGMSAKTTPGGSLRVLTLTAVTKRDFIEANTKLIAIPSRPIDNLWLEPGDIFIQRSNTPELVGSAALYSGERRWAIFPDLLIRVRVSDAADPAYVDLALQAQRLRRFFQSSAQGIAGSMPKISQPIIEAAEIPLPAVTRQREIVAMTTERLEAVNRMSEEVLGLMRRVRSLRSSLLGAAFSGRLAGQDPWDEPAALLLNRIRAERSAKPRKAKVAM